MGVAGKSCRDSEESFGRGCDFWPSSSAVAGGVLGLVVFVVVAVAVATEGREE
jgi:hypothetical protein